MSVEKLAVRCIQCGWTKSSTGWDEVFFEGRRVLLHKGGCTNAYDPPKPTRKIER